MTEYTFTQLLKDHIDETGYKQKYIAKKMGIDAGTFSRKLHNHTFTPGEFFLLCDIIKLKYDDYYHLLV